MKDNLSRYKIFDSYFLFFLLKVFAPKFPCFLSCSHNLWVQFDFIPLWVSWSFCQRVFLSLWLKSKSFTEYVSELTIWKVFWMITLNNISIPSLCFPYSRTPIICMWDHLCLSSTAITFSDCFCFIFMFLTILLNTPSYIFH